MATTEEGQFSQTLYLTNVGVCQEQEFTPECVIYTNHRPTRPVGRTFLREVRFGGCVFFKSDFNSAYLFLSPILTV